MSTATPGQGLLRVFASLRETQNTRIQRPAGRDVCGTRRSFVTS